MAKLRIAKRSVDALTCPAAKDRVFLWDDAVAGFGVAAFPTGNKTYVVQYRRNGRSRRVTIGDHGRLTPDQARSEAKELLDGVEQGIDVIEQRRAARAVRTFNQVADEFLKLHIEPKRKDGTRADYAHSLDRHIHPAIGAQRVTDISRSDMARLHAKMVATPFAANRALAVVSSIWNWAAERDKVDGNANLCSGIERYE
jgi:hypothetical protein